MPIIRETLLANIISAVGGQYDVQMPEDDRDLPFTNVRDDAETATEDTYGRVTIEMPITVERAALATSADRDVMRQEAHDLLGAVIAEMFADETFGGVALSLSYDTGGISTELAKLCFAQAGFTVRYRINRGDPTTN